VRPITQVLKEDIENFVQTKNQLYQIYYMTYMRPPTIPPTLHFLVNYLLAFDYRYMNGPTKSPRKNNMKWASLTLSNRNYLIEDLIFYYNLNCKVMVRS
jgi:hypothetical protein